MKIVEAGMRWLYGLFYGLTGMMWFVDTLRGAPTVGPSADESAAAKAFSAAVSATGFGDPLIAAVCLLGGGLLLVRRTAPVGLLLLTPLVVGICLFHLQLNTLPYYRIWGAAHLACLLLLLWRHRDAYRGLWQPRVRAARG
ncbi:hypothetical protein AO715_05230 [Xanthomonas sp. Mitacek01]|nr:hypothetical protein AO715_05230 [Xanthomonas sp. Mitacek01]